MGALAFLINTAQKKLEQVFDNAHGSGCSEDVLSVCFVEISRILQKIDTLNEFVVGDFDDGEAGRKQYKMNYPI